MEILQSFTDNRCVLGDDLGPLSDGRINILMPRDVSGVEVPTPFQFKACQAHFADADTPQKIVQFSRSINDAAREELGLPPLPKN